MFFFAVIHMSSYMFMNASPSSLKSAMISCSSESGSFKWWATPWTWAFPTAARTKGPFNPWGAYSTDSLWISRMLRAMIASLSKPITRVTTSRSDSGPSQCRSSCGIGTCPPNMCSSIRCRSNRRSSDSRGTIFSPLMSLISCAASKTSRRMAQGSCIWPRWNMRSMQLSGTARPRPAVLTVHPRCFRESTSASRGKRRWSSGHRPAVRATRKRCIVSRMSRSTKWIGFKSRYASRKAIFISAPDSDARTPSELCFRSSSAKSLRKEALELPLILRPSSRKPADLTRGSQSSTQTASGYTPWMILSTALTLSISTWFTPSRITKRPESGTCTTWHWCFSSSPRPFLNFSRAILIWIGLNRGTRVPSWILKMDCMDDMSPVSLI